MNDIRFKRKRGRPRKPSPELETYFHSIASNNTQEHSRLKRNVRRALMDELTERQRELILMRYGENKTQAEIADILGLCPSTVSRTIKRAENKLRKFLKYGADRIMLNLYDE